MEKSPDFFTSYAEIYLEHLKNANTIAKIRNAMLKGKHGHLPSYAIWSSEDIKNETKKERLEWLASFTYKH